MNFPPVRAWLLVASSSLFFLSLFYLPFGRLGLFIGLAVSYAWNYAMLLHKHKSSVDHFSGRLLEGRDPWNLNEIVDAYKQKMRTSALDIYLCQEAHPVFIASTSEWRNPYLLVSQGLIDLLTANELKALMAMGVATLKHRQTFFRYTLDRMALSWISLGLLMDNLLPFGMSQWRIASRLNYAMAWLHLKTAYPQSLQARADLEAYQSVAQARDLATALWKLHGNLNANPLNIPSVFMHQSLLGPSKSRRSAFQFILPIEVRLRFLVGYFPI
jgi:Zn-dependent protease with chaperone function